MREIKFRWVGVIDGESKARPHAVVGIHWGAMVVELEGDEGCTYPIAAGSLEQFTGLLDSQGKEIYDGDILEHKFETKIRIGTGAKVQSPGWKRVQIEYSRGCFTSSIISQENCYFGDLPSSPDPVWHKNFAKFYSIIGTIHETPNYWRPHD